MQTTKLFLIIKLLDADDIRKFLDFAGSHYFNNNKELTLFLQLIIKGELYSKDTVDKGKILRKIYPGAKYDARHYHDLSYRLLNLLEDFLSYEKYKQNAFQQRINLMSLAYEKEFSPLINGIEKGIEHLHQMNPIRDSNFFYEAFMIQSQRDYSFRLLGKISDDQSLQGKTDQLDLFYFAQKLKDGCEMLNRSNIVSANYDFKSIENAIGYLQSNPTIYLEQPSINIYLNIYLMLSTSAHETHFTELEKLVRQNETVFSREELRSVYAHLENYCIRRINQGSTAFYQNLFDLFKHIYEIGLVFEENKNMQWDFKNFVSIGLRLKQYQWTFEMIKTFKDHLPGQIRENAYTYNLANYYYETGEYQKATKLLNSVEFTDIYYNLDSKAMLLKIYYKVEEEESLYSLVSSFGIYLTRNKFISKDNAEVYANLIRFTKKAFVLKLKPGYQRTQSYYKKAEVLKQRILDAGHVANINWLLQEIDTLLLNE